MQWEYILPGTIHFGAGRIRELGDEIRALGKSNGILVTSPSFVRRGVTDQVIAASGGLIKTVYSSVAPNPDVTECQACVDLIRANGCDFAVALGGGSVMDCAKAAACMCMADLPVTDYMEDASLLPAEHLPLIAVPTTAGTASEVTSVSVLSDHAKGVKKPLASPAFYPKLAIIDPELTYSVPAPITASTGLDVLCHSIEAYWSRRHQPICDALALYALRLVFANLRTVCAEPDNAAAREHMAEASVIAGLAFAIPRTNSSHACSYPLTNQLGIPHGEACALTVDHFLRINAAQDDGRLAELARQLGFGDAYALADAITKLKRDIGMRSDLKDFRLDDEKFEALVRASMHPNLANNPVEITEQMLRDMYQSMR